MEDVLPPPVLGALVAAPPQIHFVGLPISSMLLAVLAGAEPVSNDGVEAVRPRDDAVDANLKFRKRKKQTLSQHQGFGGMLKCTYFSLHVRCDTEYKFLCCKAKKCSANP